MEKEKSSLSVEIDKDLLLKFKSMCVLREHTMAEEIEKMISDWVSLNKDVEETPKPESPPANQPAKQGGPENKDLSDELEDQAEKM